MKLTDEQRYRLEIAATNANMEPRAYSGRAMFGQYCFGVVTDNPARLVQFGQEIAKHPDLADMLTRPARWDSMGRDETVYYWEGLQVEPDDYDEDDED